MTTTQKKNASRVVKQLLLDALAIKMESKDEAIRKEARDWRDLIVNICTLNQSNRDGTGSSKLAFISRIHVAAAKRE